MLTQDLRPLQRHQVPSRVGEGTECLLKRVLEVPAGVSEQDTESSVFLFLGLFLIASHPNWASQVQNQEQQRHSWPDNTHCVCAHMALQTQTLGLDEDSTAWSAGRGWGDR